MPPSRLAVRVVAPALAGALLVGAASGCGVTSDRVEARLLDGQLSLRFERTCPVGMLTLIDPARRPAAATGAPSVASTGTASVEPSVSPGWEAEPEVWWQIRTPNVNDDVDLRSVVVGEPADGFEEVVDRTEGELPQRLNLRLNNAYLFDADIDVTEVADGQPHHLSAPPGLGGTLARGPLLTQPDAVEGSRLGGRGTSR
ncbi:hypothetical protein Q2K19_05020 [Micromonospora soli]|uniref:hypothetical protein n=1 Tax=Micromonospora sp. NBRC 110009 TaxID=3061627 RepID=UPI002673DAAA|nr:hypothetical protein [Micromonospora sp. NBRC 110009]WKT99855.1 hypothetical protein Q2K19_05020 [Micromonospora sp. NBRC 110009]